MKEHPHDPPARDHLAARTVFLEGAALAWAMTLPAGLSVGLRTGLNPGLAVIAAWGSAASLAVPAAGFLRLCRPFPAQWRPLALGLVLALPILATLGEVLKRTTHHRPLGAATFTLLGVLLVFLSLMLGWGLVERARQGGRLARGALVASVVCAVLLTGRVLFAALGEPARSVVIWGVADTALVMGVLLLARVAPMPARLSRYASWMTLVGYAAVVAAAVVVLRAMPELRGDLAVRAPVLVGLGAWLSG